MDDVLDDVCDRAGGDFVFQIERVQAVQQFQMQGFAVRVFGLALNRVFDGAG